MTSLVRPFKHPTDVLALALVAAYAPTQSQTVVTDTSVNVGLYGITGSSNERAQFGQYNGLRNVGPGAGILGFEYYRQDAEQGRSVLFTGTDLALQTRALDFAWQNQGDWKLSANYNEQIHYDPYSVNTGMRGFGSTSPQVVPLPGGTGTGNEYELKVKRTSIGLGLWKSITPTVNFEVKLKSEDRDGSVMSGIGFSCPSSVAPGCLGATGAQTGSAVLMLAEPINTTRHRSTRV